MTTYDPDLRRRWEEIKEANRLRDQQASIIRQHGRAIKGYCSICGGIRELDGSCDHSPECHLYEEETR